MSDTSHADRGWPGGADRGGDWLAEAAGEVAQLGFVLRDGSEPGTVPGPRLLIALRAAPTLEHFDPEEATYWAFAGERGTLESLTRESARKAPLPMERPFSWGRLRVLDRIPVHNQFLSFGGTLRAGEQPDGTIIAAFGSRAPILRWAGHSQEADPFVDEVGSFFARLMVPVDFQEGAEARIGATSPEGLYAAALQHANARIHAARRLAEADPGLATTVAHEAGRLAHDAPAAWHEGEELLGWLQLG
ncbi:MAG TPA: hypothetical protein VGK16_04510 [Candidatus Limnocylindrales bacterium]|jgi:hypothetical protein